MSLKKIILPLFCSVFLVSCLESEDQYSQYRAWQLDNERVFKDWRTDSIQKPNTEVLTFDTNAGGGEIVVRKDPAFVAKEGALTPIFTDSVVVYYRGKLINDKIFDSCYSGITDEKDEYTDPRKFVVGSVIRGWTEVLQRMKEGEKWKVVIPQEYAYGSQIQTFIPPFSTLIFDIELIKVVRR